MTPPKWPQTFEAVAKTYHQGVGRELLTPSFGLLVDPQFSMIAEFCDYYSLLVSQGEDALIGQNTDFNEAAVFGRLKSLS